MKKIFSSALLLGLALGLNSAISAQDSNSQNPAPNAQEKMGRKNRMGKMRDGARRPGNGRNGMLGGLNSLNLTDAQRQQLQNLRQNNRPSEATRNEMRQLMEAQRSGALTDAQRSRLNTLREQNRANAERMQQQVLAILTPEQRQQLEQTRLGRNDRMGDRTPDQNRGGENRRMRNREERGNRRSGGEGRFEGLNLTDVQREQLRNLRTNNRSDDATRQEMRELREAKRNGSLTAQQENRLKTLREQLRVDIDRRQQQILSILTPEQRRQLEQNQSERRGRRNGQRMENSPLNRDK